MRLHSREKQIQCHSHPVDHRMKCNETVHGQETQLQYHSHAVDHGMQCNETAWSRKTSVTHWLLVMG